MISVETHSLVGSPNKLGWSQAQSVWVGEIGLGVILSLKKTESEGMLDLASVGGGFLQKIQNDWNREDRDTNWLMQLRDEVVELEGSGIVVNILAYQINLGKLMIWGSGRMETYLMRAGNLAKLGDSESLAMGVEGVLLAGDVVVMASEEAREAVGLDEIADLLADEESFEDNLAPLIYRGEETASRVVQILNINPAKSEEMIAPVNKKWVMPSLRIQRMSEEPKKFNLIFGIVLIVGLSILVLTGIVSKSKKQAEASFIEAKTTANRMVVEAKDVAESNPERAKILLSQASETLNAYIATAPKQNYLDQAKLEIQGIESSEKEILKVRGIELKPTVELELVSSGLKAVRFESDSKGNIYFWDGLNKNITGFNLKDASSTKFAVKDVNEMGVMAVVNGGFFGVVPEGIWQGSTSAQKVAIQRDELWGQIGQIGFFGSNIYLLDKGNGEIWKYSAVADGYADRKRWFGAGIVLDLSRIVDWVVDGDIWLLSSSGKLERYSRGVPVKFELVGLPAMSDNGALVGPSAVVINQDKIYVLESGASRVVVFGIDGKYEAQFVSSDFARASDLAVYDGKGYVLIDNIVKEWEL